MRGTKRRYRHISVRTSFPYIIGPESTKPDRVARRSGTGEAQECVPARNGPVGLRADLRPRLSRSGPGSDFVELLLFRQILGGPFTLLVALFQLLELFQLFNRFAEFVLGTL